MIRRGDFARLLRATREARQISKSELARLVGVKSVHSVRRWESTADTPPPLKRVKAIAAALEVTDAVAHAMLDQAAYERAGAEFIAYVNEKEERYGRDVSVTDESPDDAP